MQQLEGYLRIKYYDKTVNQFTVGKVDIQLEAGRKPEEHTKIEPGKDIQKYPN